MLGGLYAICMKKRETINKGDAVNPIVNTVLLDDILKDWVWRQLGMDGKRLFAQQHGHNRHE